MNRPAKGIRELNEGEQVERVFLVRAKQGLVTKNGNPYVSLKLADRTGEIDAKIWDRADDLSARFKKDDFVRVRGVVSSFQGAPQITVRDLDPVPPDQVAVEEFLPASKRSLDEMAAAFRQIADSVSNPHIRALILSFADDDAFMNGLKRAPAAKGMHHVYIGGLIEHILDLVGLARDVVPHFPWWTRSRRCGVRFSRRRKGGGAQVRAFVRLLDGGASAGTHRDRVRVGDRED